MPGSSKVNGAWKTITGLSVKVGGQWKTATSGYIKVGGQWKQWFASKIQDAFNRSSTALGLGVADSGQAWNATRGNWRISGSNTAISDDAATSYALASINLGNTDVKIQTDTTGGVGPAFWVTDSGSWWASYPRYTSSTVSYCDQSLVSNTSNPPSASCCSGVTSSSSTVCDQGQVTNQSNPPAGNCCSGVSTSGGGSACTGSQVTNTSNPPSGNCCSGVSQGGGGTTNVCDQSQVSCGTDSSCSGKGCCSGVSSSGGGTSTVCDQGLVSNSSNPPSGSCCSSVSTSTTGSTPRTYCCAATAYTKTTEQRTSGYNGCTAGVCGGGACNDVYTATYCCAPGQEITTYSCYYPATTGSTTYSCYTSSRTVSNPTTYSCYTSTRAVNNPITYSCYTSFQTQPTFYSCYTSTRSVTTYSCYTGTRSETTYTTDIVVVSSVSGTVVTQATSNISTNLTGFTTVGSIYVTTTNDSITSRGYSGSNLTGTALGTQVSYTATSPIKGTSVGIIKGPSTGNQGSTTDNFLATI